MCYNYFNDLTVTRSVCKRQSSNQSLNSNEMILRNRNQQKKVDRSTSSVKHVLLDKEYTNLKHLLPALNGKSKISKVNLINEAVRYINELQEQVIQKLNLDPQIIQQKILDEFNQMSKNNVLSVNSSQNSSASVSNRSQQRSKTHKSSRRTPLEEISVQKSIKRQRI